MSFQTRLRQAKKEKHHSDRISVQTRLRQAEKEKTILVPNYVLTLPGLENSKKKIKKTSFQHYFYPNRDEIRREREKKNLVPNSVPNRPGLEIPKKKGKKIQNFKKHHSSIISIQARMRQVEKEKKDLVLNSVPDLGQKISKMKCKKIQKI